MKGKDSHTLKSVTVNRVYDLLMDIRLRHNREIKYSITGIVREHAFSPILTSLLKDVGYISKDENVSNKYTYANEEPSIDIATKIFNAYKEYESKARKNKEDEPSFKSKDDVRRKIDRLTIAVCALYKELTGRELNLENGGSNPEVH